MDENFEKSVSRSIYGKLTKSVSREFWRVKMLEVQELTKKYGKNVAVDHVSFMVQDGQVGILLGPNGAGKSTIIKLSLIHI